jgi:four helix bundle protein
LAELDTLLRLGIELGFCTKSETAQIGELIEEMRRMLNGLRRNLSAKAA